MAVSDIVPVLRAKPLSQKTTRARTADAVLINVARHNLREIQAEFGIKTGGRIDARRIHENVVIRGPATAAAVARCASEAISAAAIKVRKNATLGIEIIVSLPAGLTIDTRAYFEAATCWAENYFRVPVLSATVHYDESCPHVHVVLLPIRDGKLAASKLLGDRVATKAMQSDFHDRVGKQFGMRLPTPQKRYSVTARRAALNDIFQVLEMNSGLASDVLHLLLAPHLQDPGPLLACLGLTMPLERMKGTFIGLMTKPCKVEKYAIGDRGLVKHVSTTGRNPISYALLGNSPSPPPADATSTCSLTVPASPRGRSVVTVSEVIAQRGARPRIALLPAVHY